MSFLIWNNQLEVDIQLLLSMKWFFYDRSFRIVHAPVFLSCFASDRRHMKGSDGHWIEEPPPHEPIVAQGNDFGIIIMKQWTCFSLNKQTIMSYVVIEWYTCEWKKLLSQNNSLICKIRFVPEWVIFFNTTLLGKWFGWIFYSRGYDGDDDDEPLDDGRCLPNLVVGGVPANTQQKLWV